MAFIWKPMQKRTEGGACGRTFVICNPHSNRDRHRAQIPREIKTLEESGLDFVYAITENPMDEYLLAKDALADGYQTIVASGGDSTISNIAEAVLSSGSEIRFGIIPSGTGNDYATGNQIPRSLVHAVEVIKQGKIKKRDVIKIGDRFSVSMVGFGFDITMSEIHLRNKTLKGPFLYLYAILVAIYTHKGYEIEVETDTGEHYKHKALMLNLGNNRISGGGYPTCPRAEMDDGKMDVMFIEDCPPKVRIQMLQRVKKATHIDHPLVHYEQATRVTVRCEHPLAFHTEGEMFYTQEKSLEATLLPERLNLIVP